MVLRAYRTEIYVNNAQQTLLLQHLGCAFNWALSKKKAAFDVKAKIPNAMELHRELNQLKKTEFPWFYRSSKSALVVRRKSQGKKGFPGKSERTSFSP